MTEAAAEPVRRTPPARSPREYRPLVFLAPARSHSSVVSAMVGSHPECFGFPELTLFDHDTLGERLDAPPVLRSRPPGWNPVSGLERAVAQLHDGRQDVASVRAARGWLEERRSWSGADVFDHLLRLVSPRIGVEKSPETVNGEDKLRRALAAYPEARFLHLARHPVTAQRSTQAHLWLFEYPVHVARGWVAQHRRILEFRAELPTERSLLVRSEDVLNAPERELARIARWLGVDDGPEAIRAMRHPERSPFASPGPEGAAGGNDPAFLQAPAPHAAELPASLEAPAEWNIPAEVWSEVEALAGALGY